MAALHGRAWRSRPAFIPISTALSYDPYQFASKAFPVETWQEGGEIHSNGIAFDDLGRMNCFEAKLAPFRQLQTPEWANNDAKCRELIVAILEDRIYRRTEGSPQERLAKAQEYIRLSHCPALVKILDKLCAEYVTLKRQKPHSDEDRKRLRALEVQIESIDTQIRLYQHDGGASAIAGVIHLFYRLGLNSVETGREIGLKPPHVRQICWRLRRTWARIQNGERIQNGRPPRQYLETKPAKVCEPAPPKKPKVSRASANVCRCGNPVPPYFGGGAKRKYCSAACRSYAGGRRRNDRLKLLRAQIPKPECTKERPITELEKQQVRFDAARVVELYRNGMTVVSQIAQAIGYPYGHGNNRVRAALRRAGVLLA